MCTISFYQNTSRIELTMNRDESRDRGPELPPKVQYNNGVLWIAPIDSVSQGTSVGVNACGVIGCLLNAYAPDDETATSESRRASRGAILPKLLEQGSWDRGRYWLDHEFEPDDHPSFMLAVISPNDSILATWRRSAASFQCCPVSNPWTMQTSSSWKTEEVLRWRRRAFAAWRAAGASYKGYLPAFHLYQPPSYEAWAPLMRRTLTRTRSITQVLIDFCKGTITLRYWPLLDDQQVAPDKPRYTITLPLDAKTCNQRPGKCC